ncbi:MAG TPA: hypothetical protein PKJ49_08435 [Limnochordia bacterium]|nr:hypothetical protein [Limnochordia bacterium]
MKKAAVAALVLLALTVSVPAAAFELSGGLWSVSEQELIPANQIENVYRANLTLVRIGPLRLTGSALYGGRLNHIADFLDLMRKDLDEAALVELDDFYVLGGVSGKVRIDWPVYSRLAVITSVGYDVMGSISKQGDTADDVVGGLYGGITYGAGLGVEIAPGLKLAGIYEYTPAVKSLFGSEDSGKIQAVDVSIEYQIPIVLARAGYRFQSLDLDHASGHRLSGFYVGVGIHF